MSHADVRGQNKTGRDSVRAWRLSNVSRASLPMRCLHRPIREPPGYTGIMVWNYECDVR